MINAVLGKIVCVSAHNAVILAGNIEYELIISSQTATKLSNLQGEERNNVRLLAWLFHREDSMVLYGFCDEDERRLFLELIKVNGIGARQAIKILSGVRVKDFIQALDKSDVNFLSKIPGLGAKTSQKVILALRNTLVFTEDENGSASIAGNSGANGRYSDIIDALVEMGYEKKKVQETISVITKKNESFIESHSQNEVEEFLFRSSVLELS